MRLLGVDEADFGHAEEVTGRLNAGERKPGHPCAHRDGEVKLTDADRLLYEGNSDAVRPMR